MKVKIIGNSSASPRLDRHPSCQVIEHHNQLFMIDCGEGSQIQLIQQKVKYSQIDHIFISHLHGDHFFGLIGLITTYYLNKRTKPLHIYSNIALKSIIDLQISITETTLPFPIIYHELTPNVDSIIFESNTLEILAFPLNHRVPTHGFYFKEKFSDFNSYAYCSDTRFQPTIVQYFKNATLLYHEATFAEDKAESATQKFHSTAKQAAQIAKLASVKKLLIGHFSAKYNAPSLLLDEAKTIFEPTEIATEGETYEL